MGTSAPLAFTQNIVQWMRRNEKVEIEHWSTQDLRKTDRTDFSTLPDPHISEIMPVHQLPGSWQVYDQHEYLHERALA